MILLDRSLHGNSLTTWRQYQNGQNFAYTILNSIFFTENVCNLETLDQKYMIIHIEGMIIWIYTYQMMSIAKISNIYVMMIWN